MGKVIINGQCIPIDEQIVSVVLHNLQEAPEGDVLVALSSSDCMLVRWVDHEASTNIIPKVDDSKKKSKPSKKQCHWLYTEVENQFDLVVATHMSSLEQMHSHFNESLEGRGRNPESFRRWVSKIKKRWVKTVISRGKRIDDLESLVVYPT